MRILIDFDYTLFNTAQMRRALVTALKKWGITEADYQRAEKKCITNGIYDPREHLHDLLPDHFHCEEAKKEFAAVVRRAAAFLYPDSMGFLQRQRMAGHHLTILSFGLPSWQQEKIDHSGVRSSVDTVITTDQPKERAVQQFADEQELAVLDDRGRVLDAMKKLRPDVITIWMRRPESPYHAEACLHADNIKENLQFDMNNL